MNVWINVLLIRMWSKEINMFLHFLFLFIKWRYNIIFMAHSHMQKMYTHYIRRCLKKKLYIKVKSCKHSILLTYIPFYAPFTSIFNAIYIKSLFVRSYNKENKYMKNYWKKIKMWRFNRYFVSIITRDIEGKNGYETFLF